MRFAKLTFGTGLTLFGAAGSGLTGTWALAVSTVVMGVAALVAVVVMEERDHTAVEGLYPAASDQVAPAIAEHPAEEGLRHAA